jgi:glycogen debranching enzyme
LPHGPLLAPRDLPVRVIEGSALQARARDEWFLTNGLGGFASGSVSGVPQRRYHALLNAATDPPVGRVATLMACAEWLVVRDPLTQITNRYELSSFAFGDGSPAWEGEPTLSPSGVASMVRFEKGLGCSWTYAPRGLGGLVTRRLVMARHRNAIALRYSVAGGPRAECWIEARPLLAMRDFHNLLTNPVDANWTIEAGERHARVSSRLATLVLRAPSPSARFVRDDQWWGNFWYRKDRERGQDCVEHLRSPGYFVLPLAFGSPVSAHAELQAIAESEPVAPFDADAGLAGERTRLTSLVRHASEGLALSGPDSPVDQAHEFEARDHLAMLVMAADQFVVRRRVGPAQAPPTGQGEASLASIIAGYPWFSDWGRDTCIALPGLLLECGRFDEARDSLEAFAALRKRGLIPNCFDNGTGRPEHNTVDASLWFVVAACRYLEASRDGAGFSRTIRQACLDIIDAYRAGTDFGIRMDADGLIIAGNAQTQLTWMDAKRDGVVFTPRFGKPVEISALWYAATLMLAHAIEPDQPRTARELAQLADLTGRSFERSFWNPARGCLFDCLVPEGASWRGVDDVRPNQLFAVSLAHSALSREARRGVLDVVTRDLLTPFGLRTLAPDSAQYRARFEGPLFERDRAYHNGTVWPWLIGPYCEALLRVEGFSPEARGRVLRVLRPLLDELDATRPRAGVALPVRQLAEVYDADEAPGSPRRADGCFAQAWSVAEVLRAVRLALGPAAGSPARAH